MNTFIFILFIIPWALIILFDQDRLHIPRFFWRYFLLSLLLMVLGFVFFFEENPKNMKMPYFGSQILLIFLVLHTIFSKIWMKLFKRRPEFTRSPKHKIDFVYTLLVSLGIWVLPYLINDFLHSFLCFK